MSDSLLPGLGIFFENYFLKKNNFALMDLKQNSIRRFEADIIGENDLCDNISDLVAVDLNSKGIEFHGKHEGLLKH